MTVGRFAQLCEYIVKAIELYSIDGQIMWYVDYTSLKLLKDNRRARRGEGDEEEILRTQHDDA